MYTDITWSFLIFHVPKRIFISYVQKSHHFHIWFPTEVSTYAAIPITVNLFGSELDIGIGKRCEERDISCRKFRRIFPLASKNLLFTNDYGEFNSPSHLTIISWGGIEYYSFRFWNFRTLLNRKCMQNLGRGVIESGRLKRRQKWGPTNLSNMKIIQWT